MAGLCAENGISEVSVGKPIYMCVYFHSGESFYKESPVDELILTLKEIASTAEDEDSKFAEAD